jgi:hypothetical protein
MTHCLRRTNKRFEMRGGDKGIGYYTHCLS